MTWLVSGRRVAWLQFWLALLVLGGVSLQFCAGGAPVAPVEATAPKPEAVETSSASVCPIGGDKNPCR